MRFRKMLKSKIHRATVTEANLDYEGSITLAPELLEAADIFPGESVTVVNITNGERLETYAIAGEPGSGEVCANGAAARLIRKNDLVIIMSFSQVSEEEAKEFKAWHVYVDNSNKIIKTEHKVPGGYIKSKTVF